MKLLLLTVDFNQETTVFFYNKIKIYDEINKITDE